MHDAMLRFRQNLYYFCRNFFTSRNLFFIIVTFIVVASIVGGLSSMNRNWRLEQKLEDARVEKKMLELEIDKLKYREKLDKKYDGETMILLPRNSEIAKERDKQAQLTTQERKKNNLEIWLDFLF